MTAAVQMIGATPHGVGVHDELLRRAGIVPVFPRATANLVALVQVEVALAWAELLDQREGMTLEEPEPRTAEEFAVRTRRQRAWPRDPVERLGVALGHLQEIARRLERGVTR